MNDLRYERMHTPLPTYVARLDGTAIAVVSRSRGGQWIASTTGTPRVSVPGCFSRHEAMMALLGKLSEMEML